MIDRLFLAHPRRVGETYLEHLAAAAGFAVALLVAGLACLTHALIPALFERTASQAVARLHDRLVTNRGSIRSRRPAPAHHEG